MKCKNDWNLERNEHAQRINSVGCSATRNDVRVLYNDSNSSLDYSNNDVAANQNNHEIITNDSDNNYN